MSWILKLLNNISMINTIILTLDIISEILSYGSVLLIIALYYLSIKKCFYKGNIKKRKLFLLSLLSNPVILYTILLLGTATIIFSLNMIIEGHSDRNAQIALTTIITNILYMFLLYFFSQLIAKRIGAHNKELVFFVTMMYSVIFSLMMRSDITDTENAPTYSVIIDVASNITLYFSAILLYHFVINALSKLTDKPRIINSKLFNIPLIIFTLFYDSFAITATFNYYDPDGCIIITLFSNIILFIFIWAFYVIINNINATNEAIEAKDMAAAAARMEARIEADLTIAKDIQSSALPNVFPPFPEQKEFELFASMNAAKEVGGDFYDFYMLNETTLGFLIADVSGKSIPGAMFMMISKTIIKSLAESGLPPAKVFTLANEKLCEGNEAEMFVTAWLGYLDLKTGLIRVANAGHNPPVLVRQGKAEYLNLKPGLMLAGMDGVRYKEQTVQLNKGDMLFLYTDGVTEAMNNDEELYGEDRLQNILSFGDKYLENPSDTLIAESVCRTVKDDIDRFTDGAEQSDDITMLCIRYIGGE